MKEITIYCDGGCRGNQLEINTGGWGAVLKYGDNIKELYGGEQSTSNNKMELTGCIKALEALKTTHIPVVIYSDSRYVVQGMNEWVVGWARKNWIKADKKPVLNKELWKRLLELSKMQSDITYCWIKGHADNEGNNRADELANIAMDMVIDEVS